MSTAAQQDLQKTGLFSNIKSKSRFLSSVFSKDAFTPSSGKEDIDFLKCVPEIRHTDIIDVYDVIFTLRMPESVPKGALWTEHTDKEQYLNFYCNNKLSVKLFFKDEMIFSDTETEGSRTSCLLSPPVNIDKASTSYINSKSKSESDDESDEAPIKASGIYYAKYNKLDEKINEIFKDSKTASLDETAFIEELAKDKKKRIEFSDKLFLNLNPLTPGSPFKAYSHHYTKADTGNFIMSDDNPKEKVKKIKKIFKKDEFENFMQFDFNLNNYTINTSNNGVEKKRGDTPDEDSEHYRTGDASRREGDSILLLLKKGEWFSIIFKNITIPLDLQIIPKDMVTIKLEIENSNPIGTMGPNNVFYRNFFCEYLLINIKKKITKIMKVREFMFGYDDMVVALQSGSKKYANKLNSMNSLARMVLEYYVKYINDTSIPKGGFDKQYVGMVKDISLCGTDTKDMFNKTLVKPDDKTGLQKLVTKTKKEIVKFSDIFSRDSIINFRNKFIQAIYRDFKDSGLSKINVDNISKILIQMSQRTDKFEQSPTVSTLVPTGINSKGKVTEVSNVTGSATNLNTPESPSTVNVTKGSDSPYLDAAVKVGKADAVAGAAVGITRAIADAVGGGTTLDIQTGGALSDMFGTENYNLMAPMCMVSGGTGLNNMVVRISKKVVQHIDTSALDTPGDEDEKEITSEESEAYVDIQIGDAIRFVYNGKIVYAIVCGFKPGKKTNEKGKDEEMNMKDFRKTNMNIMASKESQTLKMTPQAYLNVITLRGIKYLTFEYDNDSYSFADWNTREEVLQCRNDELKAGLSGKFTFSCDDEKIPFLSNGYRFPTIRKIQEAFKKGLKIVTFGSTQADIGMDFNLPSYSLPSYMSLDKVITPLNFDPIIQLLKSKNLDVEVIDPKFTSYLYYLECFYKSKASICLTSNSFDHKPQSKTRIAEIPFYTVMISEWWPNLDLWNMEPNKDFILLDYSDKCFEHIDKILNDDKAREQMFTSAKNILINQNTSFHEWNNIMMRIDEDYKSIDVNKLLKENYPLLFN